MMTDKQIPPPIDAGSDPMNIHLSYIRRDIDSINKTLDGLVSGYVSRVDFIDHLKDDADHESRIRSLEEFHNTLLGKMWGIGILVGGLSSIISFMVNHYWR